MNEYHRRLMEAPSVDGDSCAVCGAYPAERHHVVPRSLGGTRGAAIPLCGHGNVDGCHGKAHAKRLHFRYVWEDESPDGVGYWQYAETEPMKYERALAEGDWRDLERAPKHARRAVRGLPEIAI